MPLREYQNQLIMDVRRSYLNGKHAPCIVLPCGGGKSVIVAEIARKTTEKGNHVLFIVHRKELCDQIRATFTAWGVDMSRCMIGMVQTVTRHLGSIYPPALIITDENHHSKAESYRRIYDAFPKARRIGVTATPVRLDGSGLGDVNDDLVIGVSAKWLIAHHFLAPYDYYAPSMADLTNVRTVHGDFDTKGAEQVMLRRAVFGDVISHYRQLADGRKAICYCTTVRHSRAMAETFRKAGISAAHLDGETPKAERDAIIERFRSGEIRILCNVDLISEGFDVPDCSCGILLRPTKSLTLYIQQSMRCMRYQPDKRAVIIDHVGNYARHGLPDEDRHWDLTSKRETKKKQEKDVPVKQCSACFRVFPPKDERGNRYAECPFCGAPLPKSSRELEEDAAATLQRIESITLTYDSPNDCNSYQELLAYARRKGYKAGWAWYQARARGMI